MPAQKAKSPFAAKLAAAHEAHKNDTTTLSTSGEFPPVVVEGGIARVDRVWIGTFKEGKNAGEPFYMARAIVLEPKSVGAVDQITKKPREYVIEGMPTQIGPIPICDTTTQAGKETSLAEHWEQVLNQLRLLGVDTSTTSPEDIIQDNGEGANPRYESGPVLLALSDKENAPTIKFRTWVGKVTPQYPTPKANHEWRGLAGDYVTEAPAPAVEDDTAKPPAKPAAKAPTKAPPKPAPTKAKPEEPPWEADDKAEQAAAEEAGPDLDELAAKADAADEDAQREICAQCDAAGLEGYAEIATWAEVVAALKEKLGGGEDEQPVGEAEAEAQEEAPAVPEKSDVVFYKPSKAKKAKECRVVMVFAKAETVTLLDLDDKKTQYKNVPFAELVTG